MSATQITTETIYEAVIDAIVEYHRQGYAGDLNPGNWYFVEVSPTGVVSLGQEISPCYSANEYFSNVPHYLTVWSQTAATEWPSGDDSPLDGTGEWLYPTEARADVENVVDTDGIRRAIEKWVEAGNLQVRDIPA